LSGTGSCPLQVQTKEKSKTKLTNNFLAINLPKIFNYLLMFFHLNKLFLKNQAHFFVPKRKCP
jgi:hypothetical protein